jgi:pSer/pThr/pTyr-binding forkhead associated (FHA) protein
MKMVLRNVSSIEQVPDIVVQSFPFVIGRRTDNHACLPLLFVSRKHCQFTSSAEGVFVHDLESHNGTFVNGRRASTPLPVRDGDEVSVGFLSFRVMMVSKTRESDEELPCLRA